MDEALRKQWLMTEQDSQISEIVAKERSRLRNFIRRSVPDPRDAEDILQDVFYELVEANRLLMPIGHITGWLFRVARNRIIDVVQAAKGKKRLHLVRSAHGEERSRRGALSAWADTFGGANRKKSGVEPPHSKIREFWRREVWRRVAAFRGRGRKSWRDCG
jgi:DNA-directed RNA polymerase specialized sigma24 family protein